MALRGLFCCLAVLALSAGTPIPGAAQTAPGGSSDIPTPAQLSELASDLEDLPIAPGGGLLTPDSGKPTVEAPASTNTTFARSRRAVVSADDLASLIAADSLRVNADGTLAGTPATYSLTLFDDFSVRVVKLEMTENELGHTVLRGAIVGGGEITLVIDGVQITGAVRVGAQSFRIHPERGGHRVVEFDPTARRQDRNDAIPLPAAPPMQSPGVKVPSNAPAAGFETAAATAPATIKLLIVYTAAAAAQVESISAAASLAVAYTNTALSNSETDVQFSLAGIATVDIDEAELEMGTLLSDYRDGGGDYARIQTLRANLGADLVQFWIGTNGSPDNCGLGYLLSDADEPGRSLTFEASFGVSVVTTDFGGACLTDTVAHELGHNLGSDHDRFVVEDAVAGPEGYNYGYVDLGFFRDIMAYDDQCIEEGQSCPTVQYFSNPNVNLDGRSTGVDDTTATAANSARKVSEIAQVVSQFDTVLTPEPLVRMGRVSSGLQTLSGSFLRFLNTGTATGRATITFLSEAGEVWGEWTSPDIAPDAELQFSVTSIEAEIVPAFAKPAYYSVGVRAGFQGYTQHVLYRADDGTLTNLSTCSAGVTADRTILSGVHSSLIAEGFPSSVVINNTASFATSVSLGIYDALTGIKRGTYISPSIPANGQAVVAVTTMEASIGVPPASNMYHYVIKAEGQFDGFLQHLVNNTGQGVITDMTTACALDGSTAVAATSALRLGAVFSTQQATSQSYLRFHNTGTSNGTITATARNFLTGQSLGQWTSSEVAPNAEVQFGIGTVESALNLPQPKPDYYSLSIQSNAAGYLQHALYRPIDGTLTNLSTCRVGVTAAPRALSGVHSSILENGFPSSIVINNTGDAAVAAKLTVYDANTGAMLGGNTYTSAMVPPKGHLTVPVLTIETALGLAPASGEFHYVIEADPSLTGFLQHLVNNVEAGVITDMTTTCAFPQ